MKLTQRILLLVWLLVATMLQAQTFSELQRSAEISFRKKEYFQAKTAALQAREKARTEEEKNAATLLLAGILSAMGEKQEARQEYQKILTSPASSAFQQAEALTGLARLLLSEKDFDQARGKLAKIFNLAVDEKIKNRALTDYLSTWVEISDMAGLKEAVSRLVEEKQESWPGYRIHLLSEAGRLLSSWRDWTVRDYRTSREYYRKILTLPEVSPATIFNTRLSIAKTYSAEGNPAAARKVLTEILSSKSLSMTEKTTVFREIAKTYTAEKDYNSARAVLEAALRAEDLPETTVGSILTEIAATYRSQEKLEEMARIVNRLVSLEAASDRDKIQQLFSLGDLYLKKRNYPGARESYGQVLQIKKATSGDRGEALSKLSQSCLLAREIATARGYLEQMREVPGLSEEQRLLVSLRIAGTYGAEGNIGWMKQEMAAAEKESKNLSLPQTINAYWKVSQFFLTSSDYPVVEEFLAKVNSLGSGSRKEYLCRYVSRAPVGVGGWFQSDLVKDKSNREARFYSYNIKDAAALLVADVTAQRPFAGENTGEKVGETAFYMACDREGWHIFVQADEPRIEQIVLENGRGASSLEMFFMPGENKDFYYQWIINLATGETNVYNYHSSHRYFHALKNAPGNLQVQSAVLPTGWGSVIFIPWEVLYDCLPFVEGNDSTWRFSMQRWDPAGSVTWGGRVHETGRWGLIKWEQPSEQEKLSILKRLIRRAWNRYTATRDAAVDYWSCPERGDRDFYLSCLKPAVELMDAAGKELASLDDWNKEKIVDFYQKVVPTWMEFNYQVEELRKQYLLKKCFSEK